MGIFDIFKSKTKNENEKDYAREIANIIGCDYAEISGDYKKELIFNLYVSELKKGQEEGYTPVITAAGSTLHEIIELNSEEYTAFEDYRTVILNNSFDNGIDVLNERFRELEQNMAEAEDYDIYGEYTGKTVVDGSITGVTAITPDAAGLPASISYTSDGATDLLCDVVTVEDAAAPYQLVAFNYTHLLSKVKFSVKNTTASDADNYRFVLTAAKLTNAYESGVYDVTAEAWDVDEMAGAKEFGLDLLTINSAATQYHNTELLLLPGASVGVYVKAEIQATDDGTTWKKVSEVEKTFSGVVTLAQATAYNFVVELGVGTEIQFTAAEMPDWGNGNTTDTDGDSVNDAIVK